jgi:hypothetical protein
MTNQQCSEHPSDGIEIPMDANPCNDHQWDDSGLIWINPISSGLIFEISDN